MTIIKRKTKQLITTIGMIGCLILCLLTGTAYGEDCSSIKKVGNYVTFGAYEQDNNIENGKEPIEWLVLDFDVKTREVLLSSRYGLDARRFHHSDNFPTWAKSDIRQWLNNEFLNNAFNAYERSAVVETNLTTADLVV